MRALAAAAAGALLACGGSSAPPSPSVTITTPHADASVTLGSDPDQTVTVSFSVNNFTISKTCGTTPDCGHLHLVIDDYGSPCNDQPGTGFETFNNQVYSATTATARFTPCGAGAPGPHNLKLELHDSKEADVKDASGNPVRASVSVKTVKP